MHTKKIEKIKNIQKIFMCSNFARKSLEKLMIFNLLLYTLHPCINFGPQDIHGKPKIFQWIKIWSKYPRKTKMSQLKVKSQISSTL